MRIIPCPIDGYDEDKEDGSPVYYIAFPDKWLGRHMLTAEEVKEKVPGKYALFLPFYQAIALCDDFNLPGLSGHPDKWQPEDIGRDVLTWIGNAFLADYNAAFVVKKKSYNPSENGTQA